jgi:hypothetical protein
LPAPPRLHWSLSHRTYLVCPKKAIEHVTKQICSIEQRALFGIFTPDGKYLDESRKTPCNTRDFALNQRETRPLEISAIAHEIRNLAALGPTRFVDIGPIAHIIVESGPEIDLDRTQVDHLSAAMAPIKSSDEGNSINTKPIDPILLTSSKREYACVFRDSITNGGGKILPIEQLVG